MYKKFVFLTSAVLVFSSCETLSNMTGSEKSAEIEKFQNPSADGITAEQERTYAEESLDELIDAVKNDNYKKYFRRFVRDSKDIMKESEFKARNQKFREQCGDYTSREFIGVLKKQLFNVYLWKAKYSNLPNDEILMKLFIVEEQGKIGVYAFNVQPF